MKKYLISEPEKPTKKSEKQKSASAPTNSSSTTSSLIPKLTTEPSHLQSSSIESSITLQSSLTSESIGPQATTPQENIEICEPDVSENNDSTQDANILTEKEANNINYENVCVFCDRKNKKKNSKMLPLHKTNTNQFKSSVLPKIEGCDFNPALFRKGKLRPYKILKKDPEYQEAFKNFGNNELIENLNHQQNIFNIIQRFICNVYNVPNVIDVDAARLQIFINLYTVSDVNEAFDRKKLRNFDASNLPPCKSELLQQFLRANYICTIWNNAHLKNPTTYQPDNNGWVLKDDKCQFKWFEGDQLPSYVSDSLKTQSETDEEGDVEDDHAIDWSSSDEENENIDDNA
ncbi:unnamed protein product [Leptosia nina]|uniref:Uncharacterized protein n=1 Tax=Leptosia nina TaxID=320188 RepID=A0AAV1JT50_9NEOP